ncbi:unnamed protein product [Peronospora destructor]|uniref:Uncharacterized protein n=1 Tax=Peronospora destructor TaxID=86335 RepID=A0AAV0VE71_9STRA|nr:unnamed protein product [Peronospora destructor]
MPIPSDAGLGSKEDDARLNERITKARSELSELHKIIAKDDRKLCDSKGPAARTRSRTVSTNQHDAKGDPVGQRPALLDADHHTSWKLCSVSGEQACPAFARGRYGALRPHAIGGALGRTAQVAGRGEGNSRSCTLIEQR